MASMREMPEGTRHHSAVQWRRQGSGFESDRPGPRPARNLAIRQRRRCACAVALKREPACCQLTESHVSALEMLHVLANDVLDALGLGLLQRSARRGKKDGNATCRSRTKVSPALWRSGPERGQLTRYCNCVSPSLQRARSSDSELNTDRNAAHARQRLMRRRAACLTLTFLGTS